MIKWTEKYKNNQIELRGVTDNGSHVLVIVGDGWDFGNHEKRNPKPPRPGYSWSDEADTKGYRVRISMNGPAWFDRHDLEHMWRRIKDAQQQLGLI